MKSKNKAIPSLYSPSAQSFSVSVSVSGHALPGEHRVHVVCPATEYEPVSK